MYNQFNLNALTCRKELGECSSGRLPLKDTIIYVWGRGAGAQLDNFERGAKLIYNSQDEIIHGVGPS